MSEKMNNKCLLCNSGNTCEFIKEGILAAGIPVYKCKDCGVVYLPSQAEEIDDTYWDKEEQKDMYLNKEVQKEFKDEFTEKLNTIKTMKKSGRLVGNCAPCP